MNFKWKTFHICWHIPYLEMPLYIWNDLRGLYCSLFPFLFVSGDFCLQSKIWLPNTIPCYFYELRCQKEMCSIICSGRPQCSCWATDIGYWPESAARPSRLGTSAQYRGAVTPRIGCTWTSTETGEGRHPCHSESPCRRCPWRCTRSKRGGGRPWRWFQWLPARSKCRQLSFWEPTLRPALRSHGSQWSVPTHLQTMVRTYEIYIVW